MTIQDDRRALIALSVLCEPGNGQLADLIAQHGPIEALASLLAEPAASRMHRAVHARLANRDPDRLVNELVATAEAAGARVITPLDDEWPSPVDDLAQLYDEADRNTSPPLCLWVRGPQELGQAVTDSVSIVGSRTCTPYGYNAATQLGFEVAAKHWTVVSGGAFGIDAAAHRGALAADGITIAVLACGVDRPYPASHAALFERIAQTGLVISEWPPGAIPQKHRFLVRNRVIAALTRGTVVVEAALRSGARHTARRAGELERPLMIVPGPITSRYSAGVHQIARGPEDVRIVTRGAEIVEDLGRIGADLAPELRSADTEFDKLDPLTARLLDAAPGRGTTTAEHIAAQAGVAVTDAQRRLPDLVMRGLLAGEAGGYRRAL